MGVQIIIPSGKALPVEIVGSRKSDIIEYVWCRAIKSVVNVSNGQLSLLLVATLGAVDW